MDTKEMNPDAMGRALKLLFGPQVQDIVAKTYFAINEAQLYAESQGFLKGVEFAKAMAKEDAEHNVEERLDVAFDNGFMHGMADAEEEADQAYIDGVRDARHNPAEADHNVEQIIADMGALAINGEVDVEVHLDAWIAEEEAAQK